MSATAATRATLDELGAEAYFACRVAFIERPEVRLYVRDGAPEYPGRIDLITVVAEEERRPDAPAAPRIGRLTVALGNLSERRIIEHQAKALEGLFAGRRLEGAEATASASIGWAR